MKPIPLEPNLPTRFFDGGEAIARWRGTAPLPRRAPEDWVASTTTLFGEQEQGLTRLPEGELLRDAVAADPEAYLGSAHAQRWGDDTALLVKLLDAGQRLPVHCHPDREFSRRHLDCPYGKTEAWVVIEARGPRPVVHLGFDADIDADELAALVQAQDRTAMLDAMHEVPVSPGDAILVPAGLPHAIGAGVFVLELQEPTDLSVLLEWEGFGIDGTEAGHLGLGFEVALDAVDRSAWTEQRLRELWGARIPDDAPAGLELLFPERADPYFRAERLTPRGSIALDAGFSVLAVMQGGGTLETEHGGSLDLRRGDVVLVPFGAGRSAVSGDVEVVRCRPPDPGEAGADR